MGETQSCDADEFNLVDPILFAATVDANRELKLRLPQVKKISVSTERLSLFLNQTTEHGIQHGRQ
jgi:hypothetical protein